MRPYNFNAEIVYISKEALEPIAQKYDIECDDEFYKLINCYTHICVTNRELFENRPKIKAVINTLGKVTAQAKRLADTIDGLNEIEQIWLWKGQEKVRGYHTPFAELKEQGRAELEIMGSPIYLTGIENDTYIAHYMEIHDLRAALTVIQNFAQHGIEGLPKGQDGRKTQKGMYMLISNLRKYWTETLDRSFTFDEHKGEGITEAYEFCRDISLAFDPNITPTQIKSQMRKVIAEVHEKQKNPPHTFTFNIDFSDPQ